MRQLSCVGPGSIEWRDVAEPIALGAACVTVASNDERVLELAAALGAEQRRTDFARRTDRHDLVVDCGVHGDGLLYAIASTRPEGICHSVSYHPGAVPPLPLGKMYTLGITFHIGRAHSAALLPEVVALIADGRLQPWEVTTEVVDWDDAADAYLDDTIKLVVRRS